MRVVGEVLFLCALFVEFRASSVADKYMQEDVRFFRRARTLPVVEIQNGCGRNQNRLVVFSDGTKACCKYSETTKEQQGELYTYYLSKLLRIVGVPPAIIVTLNFSGPQWISVSKSAQNAGWRNGRKVLLTLYYDGLQDEYFPKPMLTNATAAISPQWRNLVLLDYITGNTDRIYCGLVNMRWAPSVANRPVHNLGKTRNGSLIMYDNESSFSIGYTYDRQYSNKTLTNFFTDRLCHFNHHHTISALYMHAHGHKDLLAQAQQLMELHNKEGFDKVQKISPSNQHEFMKRVAIVLDQLSNCY